MRILWDEHKRRANLEKHGVDFEDIGEFDWRNAIIKPARQNPGGPKRLKALGQFEEEAMIVIFAMLGTEAIAIISFRRANTRERRGFKWSGL